MDLNSEYARKLRTENEQNLHFAVCDRGSSKWDAKATIEKATSAVYKYIND